MPRRARGRGGSWRRLVDLSVRPATSSFRPYRVGTEEKKFEVYLNGELDLLVHREWRDQQSGALSDFVMTQHTLDLVSQEWKNVLVVDAKHGTVHAHLYHKSGSEISRTVIRSYLTREELEDISRGIYDYVFDGWEENRRRWASG